jgi:hypothetical protein
MRLLRSQAQRTATIAIGLTLLVGAGVSSARADQACGEVVYESPALRICRTLDRLGGATLVLTNLDDEGNFLAGYVAPAVTTLEMPTTATRTATPRCEVPGAADATESAPVKVTVRRTEGIDPPTADETVEVSTDKGGDTTIVININNPAPLPHPEPQVVPVLYSFATIGGLPGPFRYPDHQYFLGYGPGIRSPSWFGGLGLNAGNGFGLKAGPACEQGFDCLFGPQRSHP